MADKDSVAHSEMCCVARTYPEHRQNHSLGIAVVHLRYRKAPLPLPRSSDPTTFAHLSKPSAKLLCLQRVDVVASLATAADDRILRYVGKDGFVQMVDIAAC